MLIVIHVCRLVLKLRGLIAVFGPLLAQLLWTLILIYADRLVQRPRTLIATFLLTQQLWTHILIYRCRLV